MSAFTHPIDLDQVRRAAQGLDGVAHRTPVLSSRTLDDHTGTSVVLKAENLQRVGAFKFRGAYTAMSALEPHARTAGVVAFSSGNHAQAVALAGRLLEAPATIVMPSDAPASKLAATRGYGAEVVEIDRAGDDREAIVPPRRTALMTAGYCHEDPRIVAERGTELVAGISNNSASARAWCGVTMTRRPCRPIIRAITRGINGLPVDHIRASPRPKRCVSEGTKFCVGTPADCIRFLELYEALGIEEAILLCAVGPAQHQEVLHTLRLFGEQVIPHFQARD